MYDYFKTKDEILIYFFADQLSDLTDEAQKIALQNLSADKRLRQIMRKYLESLQANKPVPEINAGSAMLETRRSKTSTGKTARLPGPCPCADR